jgi:hypothetical protein
MSGDRKKKVRRNVTFPENHLLVFCNEMNSLIVNAIINPNKVVNNKRRNNMFQKEQYKAQQTKNY